MTERSNRNGVISFDSHLITAVYRKYYTDENEIVWVTTSIAP